MAWGGFGGGFGVPAPAPAPAPPADTRDASDVSVALPPGTDTLSALAFSPSGGHLAYASWDGKIGVYEVTRPPGGVGPVALAPKLMSPDFGAPVLDLAWSPDGGSLFAVGCNKKAALWSLASNALTELGAADAPLKAAAWCPTLGTLAAGGWDSTLRYFDPRAPGREAAKVALPGKVHALDVRDDALVLATSDRKFHIFNLAGSPTAPTKSVDSPLKLQSRCVRITADKNFYLVGSPEGRCAVRCMNPDLDATPIPNQAPKTYGFAFKCHRDASSIYPINAVDVHPVPEFQTVFATAGSDGVVCFWDRDKRHRTREMRVTSVYGAAGAVPVTAARWSPAGDLFAYAMGYDWAKGGEYHDPAKTPPSLWVHAVTRADLVKQTP